MAEYLPELFIDMFYLRDPTYFQRSTKAPFSDFIPRHTDPAHAAGLAGMFSREVTPGIFSLLALTFRVR